MIFYFFFDKTFLILIFWKKKNNFYESVEVEDEDPSIYEASKLPRNTVQWHQAQAESQGILFLKKGEKKKKKI